MQAPAVVNIKGRRYIRVAKLPEKVPEGDESLRLRNEILPEILYRGKSKVKYEDKYWNWSQNMTPSEAFMAAMAAGPWKEDRVEKVHRRMMAILGTRDISNLTQEDIDAMAMPLDWQRSRVKNLRDYLVKSGQSFAQFVRNLRGVPPSKAITLLYQALGAKSRTKTIDLFARDVMCLDVVPIDRHVRRVCKKFGLKADEPYLIKLAQRAGIKPRFLARLLVAYAFTGKPFASAPKKGL